jgi:hypothetical protein
MEKIGVLVRGVVGNTISEQQNLFNWVIKYDGKQGLQETKINGLG